MAEKNPIIPKKQSRIGLMLLTATLALAGCKSKLPPVEFSQNFVDLARQPKANYRIEMSLVDVDASRFTVSARAVYRVTNRSCVAINKSAVLGGIQLMPEYELPLTVRSTANNTYEVIVGLDAVLPEDYFGLGVCNWSADAISVSFSNGTTRFLGGLSGQDIVALKPSTQHFLTRDLTTRPGTGDFVFGEPAGHYLAKMGPQFQLSFKPTALPDQKVAN